MSQGDRSLPSGNSTNIATENHHLQLFAIGISSMNGPFSIAMLNDRRLTRITPRGILLLSAAFFRRHIGRVEDALTSAISALEIPTSLA